MAFALAFLLVAAVFASYAVTLGGWAWVLLWPAASFACVGLAYAGLGVRVFGKTASGTRRGPHFAVLLPFLLVTWLAWHLYRMTHREPVWHEIRPGLFAGRRASVRELPPEIDLVVDLTSEFREPRGIRTGRAYRCLPTLDADAPPDSEFRELVEEIAAHPGRVYVHCAQGHGRTGLVVAAVLLARGHAETPADAVEAVRAVRRGVRLKPRQLAALRRFAAARAER